MKFDRYIGQDKSTIDILIDDTEQIIQGYINRTANPNGAARIMGGKELRDWFQDNARVGDKIDIQILSPVSIRLKNSNANVRLTET